MTLTAISQIFTWRSDHNPLGVVLFPWLKTQNALSRRRRGTWRSHLDYRGEGGRRERRRETRTKRERERCLLVEELVIVIHEVWIYRKRASSEGDFFAVFLTDSFSMKKKRCSSWISEYCSLCGTWNISFLFPQKIIMKMSVTSGDWNLKLLYTYVHTHTRSCFIRSSVSAFIFIFHT